VSGKSSIYNIKTKIPHPFLPGREEIGKEKSVSS
jgi:hypothetical protein